MEYSANQNRRHVIGWKHLVSTYAWFIATVIYAFYFMSNEPHQTTDPVKSANVKFNESEDPFYFVHLSDIHVSSYKPHSREQYLNALRFANESKTEVLISTGDLADDWNRHGTVRESTQKIDDQQQYNAMSKRIDPRIKTFIDQVGNHDEFDVYSYYSKNHHFPKYSQFYQKIENLTYEDFCVMRYDITDKVTALIVNGFVYPASRALLDLFIKPSVAILDKVEDNLINMTKEGKEIIVLNHFPTHWWYNVKSSRGNTFREMHKIYEITLSLSGHTHPKAFQPTHHGENLEIIAADITTHDKVGIVSIHNENTVYTEFMDYDTPSAVITSPVPLDQLTKRCTFNQKEVPIRLLVFSDDPVKITVSGDASGELQLIREVREGVLLYGMNATFEEGEHEINFTGFYNGGVRFFVGEILPGHYEFLGNLYNYFFLAYPIFKIVFVVLMIAFFPIEIEKCSSWLSNVRKDALDWLFESHFTMHSTIFAMAFGPFIMRWRIQKLEKWIRIVLFILPFLTFVLPVYIQPIEGHYGIATIYGYTNGGHTTPSVWGPILAVAQLLFVSLPQCFIFSMLSTRKYFSLAFLVDVLYLILSLIVCAVFSYIKVTESTKFYLAMSGPALILTPLIMLVVDIMYRKFGKAPQWGVESFSGNSPILDQEYNEKDITPMNSM